MSLGKYSPTVSLSYAKDQNWYFKNGGDFGNGVNPDSDLDNDGFDSYGYSFEDGTGPDRAGNTEMDYLNDADLYDRVYSEWSGRTIL